MKNRSAPGVLAACLVLLRSGLAEAADIKPVERFTCFAANMTGMGKPGTSVVQITVERWSTDDERERLRTTLIEKGPDALLVALQKTKPRVGFMRMPNTLGWDLYYARDIKRDDGTRQVILASDRPIGFREVANQTRSKNYAFTIVDIRFDAEGKGTGELAPAAKVTFNAKTNHIEIENYSARPLDLINVKSEKP
jgi:hypothetical protein